MDLDNDSTENSAANKGGLTTVGLKKSIAEAGAKSAADEEKKDEAATEDAETKEDEATKEEETTMATEATKEPEKPKHDYSLIDSLSQFLYEDEDPLPILCGYFLKVMEQLLDKQKQMTLEYLLLQQEGKIFSGLLRHLGHHSLATLLIKLIEQ